MRHQKRSLLISAQGKTQSDVRSQEIQARHRATDFLGSTRNTDVTDPGVLNYRWMSKREQQSASSRQACSDFGCEDGRELQENHRQRRVGELPYQHVTVVCIFAFDCTRASFKMSISVDILHHRLSALNI